MWNAFLSHSSQDKDIVRLVALDLRNVGLDVWFDEEQIQPGQVIVDKINEGIENSRFLLVFVSEAFLRSEWCKGEVSAALNDAISKKRDHVIPILLDDVWDQVPPLLKSRLYIDFRNRRVPLLVRRALDCLAEVLGGKSGEGVLSFEAPTLVVTGGRDPSVNQFAFEVAYHFGKLAGAKGYRCVSGTATGVDESFSRGVHEALVETRCRGGDRLTCYYNRGKRPLHRYGIQIESRFEKREEGPAELIQDGTVFFLFGGGKNTHLVALLALLENRLVLPVAGTGGAAKELHSVLLPRFNSFYKGLIGKDEFLLLANTNGEARDLAKHAFAVLCRISVA